MDIDKLITTAKNSYQTNKYRSYRECYNDGVLVLADLIRQQLLQQTHVSGSLPPSLIYIDKLIPVAKTELQTIVDLVGHDAIVLTRLVSKVEEYLAAMIV